jgi:hypothetical protein
LLLPGGGTLPLLLSLLLSCQRLHVYLPSLYDDNDYE